MVADFALVGMELNLTNTLAMTIKADQTNLINVVLDQGKMGQGSLREFLRFWRNYISHFSDIPNVTARKNEFTNRQNRYNLLVKINPLTPLKPPPQYFFVS